MGYTRRPYSREGYERHPYMRVPYGLSEPVADPSLIFAAPLLTSLEEMFGAVPTFTRASIGTYIGSDGLLKTAAVNEPRFEYDTGGGARGYLSEGERENLAIRSEEFDNAAWTPSRTTVSANATVAPDGATTADDLILDGTAASTHFIAQTVAVTSNTTFTYSAFVRPAGRDWVLLRVADGSGESNAYFNVADGAVGAVNTAGTYTNTAAVIELSPNGYWRCELTGTPGGAAANVQAQIYIAEGDNDNILDGDSTTGLTLWGAQYEEASFASSYIPTQASAVTRAGDQLRYPLVSDAPESMLCVVDSASPTNNQIFISHNSNATTNEAKMQTVTTGRLRAIVSSGGVGQVDMEVPNGVDNFAPNVPKDIALTYETNDVRVYTSGVERNSDSVATMPVGMSDLDIGVFVSDSNQPFGHIRDVRVYSRVLGAGEI